MRRILFVLLFLACVSDAHARIYILIDEVGEKRFPVAITTLVNAGEKRDRENWARKFPEILRNDLRLVGLFEFVEPDLFPRGDKNNFTPDKVDFPSWHLLGVQGLVKGGFSYDEEKIRLELYLYDPIIRTKIVGQEYVADPKEVSVVAHHFADLIVEVLTGSKGIASTQIAFTSKVGRHKEIYLMDVDGGRQRKLTSDRGINISPSLSPDSSKVAYTSYTKEGDPEIKVYDLVKKSPRQVTSNKAANLSPTWTPDGNLITVTMMGRGADIFNIDLFGKVEKRLTDYGGIDLAPSWSPDGKYFVFSSERGGRLHIFRADADGGNVKRLTFVGYHNDNPAWSPDGSKVVFQGRDEGVWDLFIMNPDGSMIQRLTSSSGNNQEPTWSPNGKYIAFSSNRSGRYQIYIMTATGENQIMIPTVGNATQPSWGP